MPELPEHPAFVVQKVSGLRVADDDQTASARQVACIRRRPDVAPEAVVAILLLEICDMTLRIGHPIFAACTGAESEPDKVVARHLARLIDRDQPHDRHAVILDLPIADRAGLLDVVEHQRLHQECPVRADARCAML